MLSSAWGLPPEGPYFPIYDLSISTHFLKPKHRLSTSSFCKWEKLLCCARWAAELEVCYWHSAPPCDLRGCWGCQLHYLGALRFAGLHWRRMCPFSELKSDQMRTGRTTAAEMLHVEPAELTLHRHRTKGKGPHTAHSCACCKRILVHELPYAHTSPRGAGLS